MKIDIGDFRVKADKALRNAWTDLVDRRLWPAAAALLVALIAIPVVLAKSGGSGAAAPPPVASTQTGAPQAKTGYVSVDSKGNVRVVAGNAKNPFTQQHLPKTTTTAAAAGPGLTIGPGTDTGSTGSGSTNGSTGSSVPTTRGGSTQPEHTVSPSATGRYRLGNAVVLFGQTTTRRPRRDLPALTALPSATNPILIFLGLSSDASKATFLVSSDASPLGDGKCAPTRSVCQTITLKAGQTEFLDVVVGKRVRQYQLDLVRILP
jgi:hypothetical protein